MSSLVIQTSFIGDVVLTTPLISELARRGPVDVVTTAVGSSLLHTHPAVRKVIEFDKSGADGGVRGSLGLLRRIRASTDGRAYDAAYLAQGSVRSALIAAAAGIRERVGFDTSSGRALYTRRVAYRPDRHHAERLWWLSMADCADPPEPDQIAPRIYPGDNDRAAVDTLLAPTGVDPLVVLAPGSMWGTKRWPYFADLAGLLARSVRLAVVGTVAEREESARISAAVGKPVVDATGKFGLLASAELIGRAAVLVSNDSAPQHLASAMGTPTIALFGPTVPQFGFGPLAPRSQAVGHDGLACRPCHRHGPERCPLGHWRCMRELSPQRIAELVSHAIHPSGAA